MPSTAPKISADHEEAPESTERPIAPIRYELGKLLKGPDIKRVLNSLREKFFVSEEDLDAAISDSLFHLYVTNPEMSELADTLLESLDEVQALELLESGASAYLKSKFNVDWDTIPPETQAEILQSVRTKLLFNPRLNLREALALLPVISGLIEKVRLANREKLLANRDSAVREMNLAFPFMAEWPSSDEGQEDALNERYYTKRAELQFLSTYFDSATFGLIDREKEKEVMEAGRRSHLDFGSHIGSRKKSILNAFDPGNSSSKSKYTENNLFFCSSASHSFRLFAENYLKPEDVVLMTEEEYQGMGIILKKRGVRVAVIPKTNSPDEFEKRAARLIEEQKPTYVLISEVSRRGTVFPVDRLRSVIDRSGQSVGLVVDGTQAIGRKQIDFGTSRPDVFFASCQKGSDYGGPSGALILSTDFVSEHGSKISSGEGTEDTVAVERFYRACDREEVGERQKKIRDLSLKLLQAIQEINQATGNRIKMLYPSFSSADESSGIFELEIEGVQRYHVNKFCRDYGVFVAHRYFFPSHRESFRIALHPCMSNDSIRLLVFALHSLAKKEGQSTARSA